MGLRARRDSDIRVMLNAHEVCGAMAFQREYVFAQFLRTTARCPIVSESAPSTNFLLDERVPEQREQTFLAHRHAASAAAAPWTLKAWMMTFANHFSDQVAVLAHAPQRCATFADTNHPNILPLESHQDVVRLESVTGLFDLGKAIFGSPQDLADALRAFVPPTGEPRALDPNERSRLERWVDELNRRRDARPMFAAPYDEVEPLLGHADWASRLRNVLGLAHLGGSPGSPLPVVLMRYNLSRAESAATRVRARGFAAIPTVLDAGSRNGPNSSFFPFPRAAEGHNGIAFGLSVNLDPGDGAEWASELLHFRIEYTLGDFWRFGEITDEIDDPQLAAARQRHFELLEKDLAFRADVP